VAPPQGDVTEPTIMIVPDTVRWTVVHEMTHHLFQMYRQRQSGYQDINELDSRMQSVGSRFKSEYESCGSYSLGDCDKNRVASDYVAIAKILDELMIRYTLEEITIESNMSKAYHAGFFGSMPDESRNSIDYIAMSSDKARKQYEGFESDIAELEDKGITSPALDDLNRLAEARVSAIESTQSEIQNIDGYPDMRLTSDLSRLTGVRRDVLCEHGDEGKFIDRMHKISDLLKK
jgi:hypothetical protein